MGNLGALFENGRGGPQSLQAAQAWYAEGAALNGRIAMHRLGSMLESGRGTTKNLTEAKVWYERAAALEYPPALNDLGRLYLTGVGVPKNYVRAKTSFGQAAQLGDAKASLARPASPMSSHSRRWTRPGSNRARTQTLSTRRSPTMEWYVIRHSRG
jgi:TPR repeat protein